MASASHIPSDRPARDDDAARLALGQRVAGTMALLGALTTFVGLATLDLSRLAYGAQLTLAVGLTVVGLVLWLARPNRTLAQSSGIWGVLTISVMLATADDFGTTPFFYLWPVVFVAYFSSTRFLAFTLAFMAVSLVPVLVVADVGLAVAIDFFIGTMLSVGLMAGLVAFMVRREARLTEQLAFAAHTDPLTGLLNRRGFDPRFAEIIESSVRLSLSVSVVMFDLDHFKRFNDDHGHAVGDEALRRVAAILTAQCREVDLVARLGGEEFAVVLPGAASSDALRYAERVASALGAERVAHDLRLTTSSGIGSYGPDDGSVSALVLRADEALYGAKSAGRARSAWWRDGQIVVGEPAQVPGLDDGPRLVRSVPREYVRRRNDLMQQQATERQSA